MSCGLAVLLFSGDQDQYCKETLYFVICQGGGSRPTAPSGSADKDLLYCNYMTIPFAFLLPTMGVS